MKKIFLVILLYVNQIKHSPVPVAAPNTAELIKTIFNLTYLQRSSYHAYKKISQFFSDFLTLVDRCVDECNMK